MPRNVKYTEATKKALVDQAVEIKRRDNKETIETIAKKLNLKKNTLSSWLAYYCISFHNKRFTGQSA